MKPKPPKITEATFTRNVLQAARLLGWRSAHFRPARTKRGWRTAVSGDGKGFPDLILIHPKRGRIIVAELKAEAGGFSVQQWEWLEWFQAAGIMWRVWRPSDWPEIEKELKG